MKEIGGKEANQHLGTLISEGVKGGTRKGPTLLCFETSFSGDWGKAVRAVNNSQILSALVTWLLQTCTSNSTEHAATLVMQRQTGVGWNVRWVPKVRVT